jgi:hypothetical protein
VINGAQITLRDTSSGTERAAASNSTGIYAFINVAPGSYTQLRQELMTRLTQMQHELGDPVVLRT